MAIQLESYSCGTGERSYFDLCWAGHTSAVELLISKGHGSMLDASPKGRSPLPVGWTYLRTPLLSIFLQFNGIHYGEGANILMQFAAAGGHVDLCALLIRLGADKTALAYDGPSSNIL